MTILWIMLGWTIFGILYMWYITECCNTRDHITHLVGTVRLIFFGPIAWIMLIILLLDHLLTKISHRYPRSY